jgi:hypothetical protein
MLTFPHRSPDLRRGADHFVAGNGGSFSIGNRDGPLFGIATMGSTLVTWIGEFRHISAFEFTFQKITLPSASSKGWLERSRRHGWDDRQRDIRPRGSGSKPMSFVRRTKPSGLLRRRIRQDAPDLQTWINIHPTPPNSSARDAVINLC